MEDENKKNKFWEPARKSVDGIRRPEQQKPTESAKQPQMEEHPKLVDVPIILGPDTTSSVGELVKSETQEPSSQLKNKETDEIVSEVLAKDESAKRETSSKVQIKKTHKKLNLFIGLLIFFILLAGGSAIYFYKKSKNAVDENVAKKQLEETLILIGKIAELPQNDDPVLAIVSDPSQLKSDAFFDDSKVGDRVLIYPVIGRAYLYRPDTNKLINIMKFIPNSPESVSLSTSTISTTSTTTKSNGGIKPNQ